MGILTAYKGFIVNEEGKVIKFEDLARYGWAKDDELMVDLDEEAKAILRGLGLPVEKVQPEIIAAANAILMRRRRAEFRWQRK